MCGKGVVKHSGFVAAVSRDDFPCFRPRSSVVEHFFGKEEVKGPIPFVGSIPAQRL
jgi:hypothetical protein